MSANEPNNWRDLDPDIGDLGLGAPTGTNTSAESDGTTHVTHYWDDGYRVSYNVTSDGERDRVHGIDDGIEKGEPNRQFPVG